MLVPPLNAGSCTRCDKALMRAALARSLYRPLRFSRYVGTMPTITLQLTVSDDMARQIDLLCSKDTPREAILQGALQLGLIDLWDTANRVQRDFLEQWAMSATGHFNELRDSRKISVAIRNGEAKPVTLPRA